MKREFVMILLALLLMPFVSAEILIGQPDEVYNMGGTLDVDVTLKSGNAINDFLDIDISCGGKNVNIYKNAINMGAGEELTINVVAVLSKGLIEGLMGSCTLIANYGDDSAASQVFLITNQIDVEIDLEGNRFDAGSEISFGGFASTKSGSPLNGFVEIKIITIGVAVTRTVYDGEFSISFFLPENAKSGNHIMQIRVFDKDNLGMIENEVILNEGILVKKTLKNLEIVLDSQNVMPGDTMKFKINAYDQGKDLISEQDIEIKVLIPGGFVYLSKLIKSGEETIIELNSDDIPGYWKIEAYTGDKTERKFFYIEELANIETSLIEDTLIVTNTGNVLYSGPVEISIGSAKEIKQVEIEVGESKKFKLSAPDGTYLININDGKEISQLGSVALTGNSIKIKEVRGGLIGNVFSPILWIFLIIVLVFALLVFGIRKIKVKKNSGIKSSGLESVSNKGEIIYGQKEVANVIAMKFDYDKKGGKMAKSIVDNAVAVAKNAGAKTFSDEEFDIAILSPSLTKQKNNELIAIRIGKRIEDMLKAHNSKFKDKVKFGIGIERGDIISEMKKREFTFTTTKNIIGKAKKIARQMKSETLLTEEMRKAVMGSVKMEKISGGEDWRVTKIPDREKHEGFLKRFVHHDKK